MIEKHHLYRCRFERKIGSSEGFELCSSMQTYLSIQLQPQLSFPVKSSPFVLDKICNKCVSFPSLAFYPERAFRQILISPLRCKARAPWRRCCPFIRWYFVPNCWGKSDTVSAKNVEFDRSAADQSATQHFTLLRKGRCLSTRGDYYRQGAH